MKTIIYQGMNSMKQDIECDDGLNYKRNHLVDDERIKMIEYEYRQEDESLFNSIRWRI